MQIILPAVVGDSSKSNFGVLDRYSGSAYEPNLQLTNLSSLRFFMENHVYAVWDFMSLLKYLQNCFAPARVPWVPPQDPEVCRLINEIVSAEESDIVQVAGHDIEITGSHYDLYVMSMEEVGADVRPVRDFVQKVAQSGFAGATISCDIPIAARRFLQNTFGVLELDQPHLVATAFSEGRESLVPLLFGNILNNLKIDRDRAPIFHAYLERHIAIDGESHGPGARNLVNRLCDGDPIKVAEARQAARDALRARERFLEDIRIGIASTPGQLSSTG
ncbi:MAG: DUF3050 domain-containing protein [Limisphaerales bacterium]